MLILASESPRRSEILERMGLEFEVIASNFDESTISESDPVELVQDLALCKALAVAGKLEDDVVLAADSVVELGGVILGKPKNRAEAEAMLRTLAGRVHRVLTGVAVVNVLTGERYVEYEESRVKFCELNEEALARYLETSIWTDKAGAYAIQEDPYNLIESYEGSLTNAMGLPVGLTKDMLERVGVEVIADAEEVELRILD